MKIGIIQERRKNENRVALTPDIIEKISKYDIETVVETNAGKASGFSDESYQNAGAQILKSAADVCKQADILCKIWAPLKEEAKLLRAGQVIIANFQALAFPENKSIAAKAGTTAFALDLLPRISRAQSMDILSSQSNLAGYKAVINAFYLLKKAVPLMMTAAGTVTPAKVMVFGAGVAGLQAIATAHRMGAQVFATDVRPETAGQIASLGAKFVSAEDAPKTLASCNAAITTALAPNGTAPRLISKDQSLSMPEGAVLVDMAAAFDGNIEGSKEGETLNIDGRLICGNSNLASEIPNSASPLFAKNILKFLSLIYSFQDKKLNLNFDDELINKTCICINGEPR